MKHDLPKKNLLAKHEKIPKQKIYRIKNRNLHIRDLREPAEYMRRPQRREAVVPRPRREDKIRQMHFSGIPLQRTKPVK